MAPDKAPLGCVIDAPGSPGGKIAQQLAGVLPEVVSQSVMQEADPPSTPSPSRDTGWRNARPYKIGAHLEIRPCEIHHPTGSFYTVRTVSFEHVNEES
jgi:hypothetical protein